MPDHCDYCGCVLHYRVRARHQSQATKEQQRALLADARATGDWRGMREQLAARGRREVWGIAFRCPGCGRIGSRSGAGHERREEVEAVAAEQNRAGRAAEAADMAAHWREEVRRRAEGEARLFADLLLSHNASWQPYLQFVAPTEERNGAGPCSLEWDCALVARIPSENAAIGAPLEAVVRCREVRLQCGALWHTHVAPDRGDAAAIGHLDRVAAAVAQIVSEEVLFVVHYRHGKVISGSHLLSHAELPRLYADAVRDRREPDERTLVRSWRGTYDRVLSAPAEAAGP